MVHSITADKEEEIKKLKYPLYNNAPSATDDPQAIIKTVFHDTEDIRDIPEEQRDQYAVVLENGINMFEGLQERQDACIRINVLFDQNIWCSITDKDVERLIRFTKLGLLNIFSIPTLPDPDNKDAVEEFYRIIQGEADIDT